VIVLASVAGTRSGRSLPPDDDVVACDWPCPGLRYEVLYDTQDGSILGVADHDPTDPEAGRIVPAPDQAVLDIAGPIELLRGLREDVGRFVVDLETLTVVPRTDVPVVPETSPVPPLTVPPTGAPPPGSDS